MSFGSSTHDQIRQVYVINLDRQRERWRRLLRELKHLRDDSGDLLTECTTRVSAVDARDFGQVVAPTEVDRTYTLGEQLFVDPRRVLPPNLDLGEEVEMSRQEIAVALSHIDVWRRATNGAHKYVLVLEDDVSFSWKFSYCIDNVWSQLSRVRKEKPFFDILYLSFREVDYGAEKNRVSRDVFKLYRGLWYLSGYVISKRGAQKLLNSLPVRGPVDLWINHQFEYLEAFCTSESIIEQRNDLASQNAYSILPVLSKIGVLNSEAPGSFYERPLPTPVFAIGNPNTGLTSLAMALSMLGYRCCSDLDSLPRSELDHLLGAQDSRAFDAYVNVGVLEEHLNDLAEMYPKSLLIIANDESGPTIEPSKRWRGRVLCLPRSKGQKWKLLCEFLHTVPPTCPYPVVSELGQRRLRPPEMVSTCDEDSPMPEWLASDSSPWILDHVGQWSGVPSESPNSLSRSFVNAVKNGSTSIDDFAFSGYNWVLRCDTFQGNMALFDPSNVSFCTDSKALVTVRREDMGVREYSSGALTTRASFRYGKFTTVLQPPKVAGLVTGMFIHRDSPRQEIDIEFLGNQPTKMLANVYYNPGREGDRFDYGYRGTPCLIDLGFDYSEELHEYTIEWSRDKICWLVDGRVVHTRVNWAPSPIPQLPMCFHINLWPTQSPELAGFVKENALPASARITSVSLPEIRI